MDVLAELQDMVDSENLGLHINIKKTKVMVFSKKSVKALIKIKGMVVGQMSALKYLGAIKHYTSVTS